MYLNMNIKKKLFIGLTILIFIITLVFSIQSGMHKVLPEPLELSKVYDLNPMGTISSGSLLIAIKNENDEPSKLIDILNKNNILAEKIGTIIDKKEGLMIKRKNGKIKSLKYSETDEITKIF